MTLLTSNWSLIDEIWSFDLMLSKEGRKNYSYSTEKVIRQNTKFRMFSITWEALQECDWPASSTIHKFIKLPKVLTQKWQNQYPAFFCLPWRENRKKCKFVENILSVVHSFAQIICLLPFDIIHWLRIANPL